MTTDYETLNWVEEKVGKMIEKEINENVRDLDSTFDVDECAERMTDTILKEFDNIADCQSPEFRLELDSDLSVDDSEKASQDSFDLSMLSFEDLLLRLQHHSDEVKCEALVSLEASPVEDLISSSSWCLMRRTLQGLLHTSTKRSLQISILKIFKRFLLSYDTPKIVTEGFTTLSETVAMQIDSKISKQDSFALEEIYDLKENKVLAAVNYEEAVRRASGRQSQDEVLEHGHVLIRSMQMLTEVQELMPSKWIRFNDKRLRDIIFSFINTLSMSASNEIGKGTSALEILSTINPQAEWSRYWCHTAVGRSLLCSALRRHKRLFVTMVEHVINTMRPKLRRLRSQTSQDGTFFTKKKGARRRASPSGAENHKALRNHFMSRGTSFNNTPGYREMSEEKATHSAPTFLPKDKIPPITVSKEQADDTWLVKNVSKEAVRQATFCHCFSLVAIILQYRAGRALFPLDIKSRKRQLTIQDLLSSMMDYIDGLDNNHTQKFIDHMSDMAAILKGVEKSLANGLSRRDHRSASSRLK